MVSVNIITLCGCTRMKLLFQTYLYRYRVMRLNRSHTVDFSQQSWKATDLGDPFQLQHFLIL